MMNNNVDDDNVDGILSHRYRFRIETNYMKLLDDDGINAQQFYSLI